MPRWSHPTDFFLNSKKSCSPITANDTVERIICYFRRKNCQRCLSDSRTTENDKKISRNILALKISPTQTRVFLSFLTSVKTGQYFLSAQDGFFIPSNERASKSAWAFRHVQWGHSRSLNQYWRSGRRLRYQSAAILRDKKITDLQFMT